MGDHVLVLVQSGSMARSFPDVFARSRWLGWLNVAAVALALSSIVGAAFDFQLAMALPTVLVGATWASFLRWPRTAWRGRVRAGWVLSVPLGAVNSMLIGTVLFASGRTSGAVEFLAHALLGGVLGLTLGIVVWAPAVLATLVVFGIPIAYSHRLAARGLAGEERGERIVAIVATLLGLFAPCRLIDVVVSPRYAWMQVSASAFVIASMGGAATLLGLLTVYLATARGRRRRSFLASVARGERSGYRVVDKDEGKVLVRVESRGPAYRVAEVEETVARLEDEEVIAGSEEHSQTG